MEKIHKGTTLAVVLDLAALICFFPGYYFPAGLLALTAYFFALQEVAKYTSRYQFITVFISSLLVGASLDLPLLHFPLLTLILAILAAGSIGRMMFFYKFSYTGYSWFEPLLFIVSLAGYLVANILGYDWRGWVLPLPVLVFSGILGWGIIKDKKQLLAKALGGYKIQTGRPAGDFELPDQDGHLVRLSDFKGKRHMLLVFVRGDWCPGCHMMLRTYEKNNHVFQKKNVFVMAIGPDPVGVNREMVEKLGLDFKVLSDENQRTAMNYGVQMSEYDNSFAQKYEVGIPLPASFLVDKQGIVRYVSRPDKVGEFLNPSLIFPIIEQLTDA
jgi:peroxiredoxin Q/BCP